MFSFGKRPRELHWFHAGPMLFGDWGTSRLYVLGLAFAGAAHGSFFYVALMGALLLLVAWAYTVICRAYPDGGGVYAAARERSRLLGVIGGLLLFADYVVTASISALDAFHYLGLEDPAGWALGALLVLGAVHMFGPKRAGVLALWIGAGAFAAYLVLAAASVGHVSHTHVRVPHASLHEHWLQFASIVLALSGVEAVANMTGIMVPPVGRTSRWTIWPVAIEVVVLNLLFALAMNALPMPVEELRTHKEDMVRVLAEHYVGARFAAASSIVFALLLLSAASTAITGMLGISFAMARDGELPRVLGRINRFGVPAWALLAATLAPVGILLLFPDVADLASLYAIGVVGAIALNAFSTATSKRVDVRRFERVGLLGVAAVMACIWVTVAIGKPQAVAFAATILGTGLVARAAMRTYRRRVHPVEKVPFPADAPRLLLATRGDRRVVDLGLERATELGAAVVVSLVREASFVVGPSDRPEQGPDPSLDPEATEIFDYAIARAHDRNVPIRAFYAISPTPMYVIADHAVTLGVAEVHVGSSRRTKIEKVLRGSPLEELAALLPDEIEMVVHPLT